jgi:hypothetical protein
MKHGGKHEDFIVKFPYFLRNSWFAERNLFAGFMVVEPTNNTGALHSLTHTHTHTHTHMSINRMTESEIWKATEEEK